MLVSGIGIGYRHRQTQYYSVSCIGCISGIVLTLVIYDDQDRFRDGEDEMGLRRDFPTFKIWNKLASVGPMGRQLFN